MPWGVGPGSPPASQVLGSHSHSFSQDQVAQRKAVTQRTQSVSCVQLQGQPHVPALANTPSSKLCVLGSPGQGQQIKCNPSRRQTIWNWIPSLCEDSVDPAATGGEGVRTGSNSTRTADTLIHDHWASPRLWAMLGGMKINTEKPHLKWSWRVPWWPSG